MPLRELLVVNQSLGPLNRELLSDLGAAGVHCTIIVGGRGAGPGGDLPFDVVPAKALVKAPAWQRLCSWVAFTLQALWHLWRRRGTPVLVVTNPPLTMLFMPLLRRLLGLRYALLVYDIFPDAMERFGVIRPEGIFAGMWRRMSRRAMLDAEGIITLGSRMAQTLRRHLREGDACHIEVIPSWADTEVLRPRERADNPFAQKHGLCNKTVIMYSGNFGVLFDAESIIAAAESLRGFSDVQFVLIGGGARERDVRRLVAEKKLSNLMLLPLQPLDVLPYSLAAADCAIVCLDQGYEGIQVPSKMYSSLAAGAALLAVSPPDTELTDLVAEHGCGIAVPPRCPEALGSAIRRLHDDRDLLAACRSASRRAAVEVFSRQIGTRRTLEYLSACFAPDERTADAAACGR